MRNLVISCLTALCAACTPTLPRYSVPADAAPTGFYENLKRPDLALLEYRLAKYFARNDRPYETVCAVARRFEVGDPASEPVPLDPADERKLLRRFPTLAPSGACVRSGRSYLDSDTGVEAAAFDVHELVCETETRCSAWGGYYAKGQHGWSWYWIEWSGKEWRIRPRDLGIELT